MTLIIAGHNLEKSISYGSTWCAQNSDTEDLPSMRCKGLYVAADSSITTPGTNGTRPILGEFRKIYAVPIKVWKPSFIELYFHSYQEVFLESECFVAIAGSTLTAQHVLNLISEHLGKIRISYERDESYGAPGKYILIRHCQKNILNEGQGIDTWDEDMFTPHDYAGIVTADVIAEIIEYSINEALSSARKYKLDHEALKGMYTEFAAGIHCPKTGAHKLFTFRMRDRLNAEDIIEVYAERQEIHEGEVAVLGMRNEFEARAQTLLVDSIRAGTPPANEIFNFLNQAIDEVRQAGNSVIDRPSVLRKFIDGKLTTAQFQR